MGDIRVSPDYESTGDLRPVYKEDTGSCRSLQGLRQRIHASLSEMGVVQNLRKALPAANLSPDFGRFSVVSRIRPLVRKLPQRGESGRRRVLTSCVFSLRCPGDLPPGCHLDLQLQAPHSSESLFHSAWLFLFAPGFLVRAGPSQENTSHLHQVHLSFPSVRAWELS